MYVPAEFAVVIILVLLVSGLVALVALEIQRARY